MKAPRGSTGQGSDARAPTDWRGRAIGDAITGEIPRHIDTNGLAA